MQPLAISHAGLNGVAKGVTEVEDRAKTSLSFIGTHHLGFDFTAAPNRESQCDGITGSQLVQIGLDPVEKGRVGNGSVLDDFGQASTQFSLGQRLERIQIADHPLRLVKRTNHVLAQWMIDAGFPPDRRVNLGQQGRGNLHKRHPPHVTRRSKPSHVPDNTSTQGKQHRSSVTTLFKQGIEYQIESGPGFVNLTIRQNHLAHHRILSAQGVRQGLKVQRRNRLIGHDQRSLGVRQAGVAVWRPKQATSNDNVVAPLTQVDFNGGLRR